jgi:hypothetical protein
LETAGGLFDFDVRGAGAFFGAGGDCDRERR